MNGNEIIKNSIGNNNDKIMDNKIMDNKNMNDTIMNDKNMNDKNMNDKNMNDKNMNDKKINDMIMNDMVMNDKNINDKIMNNNDSISKLNSYFNRLSNDNFNSDTQNNQYYAYLNSLYEKNNFEAQQDLNAFQNLPGDEEQRYEEDKELYKLRLETINDLKNLKYQRSLIMNTDHNEEFTSMNNNNDMWWIILLMVVFIILVAFFFYRYK